jgi:gluconokinase
MLILDPTVKAAGQETVPTNSSIKVPDHPSIVSMSQTDNVAVPTAPVNDPAHTTRHIWLVTGPAGCGKTTQAKSLSDPANLDLPYLEADDHHTPENRRKMSEGVALTDADRWDWLVTLREESVKLINEGKPGVVLTCSALKRKYRDVFRIAPYFHPNIRVHFIFLDASEELLVNRVGSRKNHYMGAGMVRSQFADLERPDDDEFDVIVVDAEKSQQEVSQSALSQAKAAIEADK